MNEGIFIFFLENFGITTVIVMTITYAMFLIITNLPKIIDSITYFQSRKIKHITEALNSEWVDDDYKKILKKDISRLYLSGTLKIKASEKQVKEIIKIFDVMKGSCSANEVYSAIKNLPNEFYGLSLYALEEEKKKQETRMVRDKIAFIFFILVVPSFYVVSMYIHIYLRKIDYSWGWTVESFILIFLPITAVLMNTISLIMFNKKNENIIKILNGVISSKEDGQC